MTSIYLVGLNTFREMIRDRVLYGLLAFFLVTMGISLVLGELSFSEQKKISIDFGLAAVHLSSVFLSIFSGATVVFREIERKTVFTLLSHSVSREGFLIGKIIGLFFLLVVFFFGFALVFSLILYGIKEPWNFNFILAFLGMFGESLILMALSILFGLLVRPTLSVIVTIVFFLVGHWVDNLQFFSHSGSDPWVKGTANVVGWVFPNLERLNWKSHAVFHRPISWEEFFFSFSYSFCYLIFFIGLLLVLVRRKEFE